MRNIKLATHLSSISKNKTDHIKFMIFDYFLLLSLVPIIKNNRYTQYPAYENAQEGQTITTVVRKI